MLDRLELPLRDLLRVFVPGLLAAASLDWVLVVYTGDHAFRAGDDFAVLPVIVLLGVVSFAAGFHKFLPPWKGPWNSQLETIRRNLESITGQSVYATEQNAKPIYKIWLDAICVSDVRTHLHYTTGLFYTFVSLSVLAFIVSLAVLPIPAYAGIRILVEMISSRTLPEWLPDKLRASSATLLLGLGAGVVFLWQSMRTLKEVVSEGVMAMHLESSVGQLRQLAITALRSVPLPQKPDALKEEVKKIVAAYRPVEAQAINTVPPPVFVEQFDVRAERTIRTAHLTMRLDKKAAASVNGRANLYSGPIQKQIELELSDRLACRLGAERVRLQVMADGPLDVDAFGAPQAKEIARVKREDALAYGIVPHKGAIDACCERLGIEYVLLRNGHVIGPSPDLEKVLREVVKRVPRGARVVDPFAGTYLTSKVCREAGMVVVCNDRYDENGAATKFDAYADVKEACDVLVVDPLHEDVLFYLTKRVPAIDWKYIVVQCGRMCDVEWNRAAEDILNQTGAPIKELCELAQSKRTFVYQRQ